MTEEQYQDLLKVIADLQVSIDSIALRLERLEPECRADTRAESAPEPPLWLRQREPEQDFEGGGALHAVAAPDPVRGSDPLDVIILAALGGSLASIIFMLFWLGS